MAAIQGASTQFVASHSRHSGAEASRLQCHGSTTRSLSEEASISPSEAESALETSGIAQPGESKGRWRGSDVLAAIRPPAALDPGLYVVATPIGNLEDITLRALRVLRDADFILAEDTRHSRKLLSYFGIITQQHSFHEHNEHAKEAQVLERLGQGAAVALISDAGMPAVSDPGAKLIAAAVDARHPVIPVPGPSAVLASLGASGLPTESFQFVGFLPPKASQRQKRLQQLTEVEATLIFYTPPRSVAATLADMVATFGDVRRCVVAREMTKLHEEFHRGTLAEVAAEMASQGCKGEVTIVVEGTAAAVRAQPSQTQVEMQLRALISDGMAPSQAAKAAALRLGVPRSAVYEAAVRIGAERQ